MLLSTLKLSCQGNFVEVAKADEIPAGKMKHIEVNSKEIMLVNLDGKFYALSDRCSHTNARLSLGTLNGKVVTCPLHGARFDITTGKKVKDPMELDLSKLPEPIPESLQKIFANSARIISIIKTYDQESYETKVEGDKVEVKI
ncbi:MAG: non-heme iron oxygenase ferredoxin subunit [Candidatus Nitrosopolaris sp.]